jgi:hypothetical protein
MYDGAAGAVGDSAITEDTAEGTVDDGGGGAVVRRTRVVRQHVRSVWLKEAALRRSFHSDRSQHDCGFSRGFEF